MHSGGTYLISVGSELPPAAWPAEWIENAGMLIVCGKVIRRRMKARMFSTWNGNLYIKIDQDDDAGPARANLAPGVYFDLLRGARFADFKCAAIKPGILHVETIIRMCRLRVLRGQNENVWSERKKFLRAIVDLYEWLDVGVYKVRVDRALPRDLSASTDEIIRRPDFAGGRISEKEKLKLEKYINIWTMRGRQTKAIEAEKLIPAINDLYQTFGLKAPRVVIAPSPLAMAIEGGFSAASSYAIRNPHFNAKLDSRAALGFVLFDDIYKASVGPAFRAVEDQVDGQARKSFEKLLDDLSGGANGRSFGDSTASAISAAIADAKLASGHKVFGRSFGNPRLRDLMLGCVNDCGTILTDCNVLRYDQCLTSALEDVLGLQLPAADKRAAWRRVVSQCTTIFFHEEFCIVSDFPEVLNVDAQNRPHCDNGPSCRWKDGWELFHWHGTRVTREIIEHPERITIKQIKREPNLEVRRVLLERYGVKKFLIDSNASEIHRDQCGILYSQVIDPALEPIVMVKVANATEEPDGTFKDYFLRVPPFTATAREGVAWTFGVSAEDYCPMVQT